MAIGTTRREGAQDSLAGRADMQPVTLQGPGVQNARAIQPADTSMQRNIIDQLGKWGSQKLAVAANKRNEKDFLEGQMAYQQGKALDDVNMGGNKWALEGHMFMDAQTLSSSMLAAQREDISLNSHTSTPDEFRARYVQRLDQMLEGKDPRTAEIVREQMSKQMPTLVADHTAQHMRYKEGQNFDSLERSIDVISRDPTSTDMLVSFAAGGEGSASEGLSPERRQAAVVSGVVRAFENDNPLAFAALVKEGVLGDSLSTQEQSAIRGAKAAFENRRRSEYNETLFNGEQALMTEVENGRLTPTEAVEDLAVLYADHGIEMNRADAGAIYSNAENGERNARQTRGILLEEAGLRGDLDAQANIIADSLTGTESSGNAQAHRTNDDGRSFGGLLQMGQGRLDDWSKANGTPRMTVAKFTALSGPQQKAINQWHIKDLIKAANATGAIGSTINGVTVTLSGLVAVAHLGGKGGMQKFVSSNGAYNPGDGQAVDGMKGGGTTLTDYLSKHGSGEMQEMYTPQQRQEAAVEQLTKTRERLALETYEQIAPKLADLDNAFERQEITQQEWRAGRDTAYQSYNVARTQADVNHEISVATGVEDELIARREVLVKEAQTEDEVVRMEGAQSALLGQRAQYEGIVNDPNSTPGQIASATAAFRQARADTFDAYNIPPSDRGNVAANEAMYTKMRDSMERNRIHAEGTAEIRAAEAGGYLGDLSKDLQARAFKEAQGRIVKEHTDNAQAGRMTDEQANAAIASDINTYFAETGTVDPGVAMRMSAAVLGPLIDKEGNPNPKVTDAIAQYIEVKTMNPRAAAKFLDAEAMVVAEAVFNRSDGGQNLEEGVRMLGVELSGHPSIEDNFVYMQRRDVQDAVTRGVSAFIDERDIGKLHAMWQNDATLDQRRDTSRIGKATMQSEETRALIQSELETEVSRLQLIHPQIKNPRDLVGMASERLERRMEIVGSSVVTMAPGVDIASEFFGAKANDFEHDGAVNSAVMEWLRADTTLEQYPFLNQIETSEYLPGFVQKGINAVMQPFGGSFTPGMTLSEQNATSFTGVRPFETLPTADGKGMFLRVLMSDGNYSNPIMVPMAEAGQMYMDRRKAEKTQ